MDPPFKIDEKVYCEENGGVYEGVIRNAKLLQDCSGWSFFVHYVGFNSRYDGWLPQNAILKQNRKKRSASSPSSDQETSRPRKRVARGNENLPFTLKTVLIEEYECIGRGWQHRLPAAVPIKKLLSHYQKRNENSEEFCQSVANLFQEALPKCLLYPQEYAQYEALPLENKSNLVSIYGCEYLLRMCVRLPVPPEFSRLLVLIQKNRCSLFPVTLVSKESPSANYQLPDRK